MRQLTSIPLDTIVKVITPVLGTEQSVAGAYLFGSALELCRPDSDIDIGLVISPLFGLPEEYYEGVANNVINQLPPVDGHYFDIVPLNIVNSIFAFGVIKKGRLLYNRHPGIITDFIEKTSRLYAENYFRYREALRIIVGV